MMGKKAVKWIASVMLLTLAMAAIIPATGAAPPTQEPESIACGDAAYCSTGGNAVYVQNSGSGPSIYGNNTSTGDGLKGRGNPGVYGFSYFAAGVRGKSNAGVGVKGESVNKYGVQAYSSNSHAIYVEGAGANGVDVVSAGGDGYKVYSAGHNGVHVASANWSGVYVNSSGGDAIRVQTAGQDGLRFFEGMGRDYIRAGADADLDFKVTNNGTAYADGGWQGPADFAELMVAEGKTMAYGPGDVLVISTDSDRAVALSSEPHSTMVIGVYSEKPGFVGSPHVMEGQREDEIPVAVVGIVPCKVSAENGAINRGDLLVTASTPGHAMRADAPSPGTILGKALEPLEKGSGLILVLVTLQ